MELNPASVIASDIATRIDCADAPYLMTVFAPGTVTAALCREIARILTDGGYPTRALHSMLLHGTAATRLGGECHA